MNVLVGADRDDGLGMMVEGERMGLWLGRGGSHPLKEDSFLCLLIVVGGVGVGVGDGGGDGEEKVD